MKQIIKSVLIKRLWGINDISINLYDDINILIGGNGSGKTTFLSIIESILNLDLAAIDEIEFDEVKITIETEEDEYQELLVQRIMEDIASPMLRYIFPDGETIDIRYSDTRISSRSRLSIRPLFNHLKLRLSKIINISWLSINRLGELDRHMIDNQKYDVDNKLSILMNQIVSYRLQLETKVNERTRKFNENLMSILLYNQQYDSLPKLDQIEEIKKIPTENLVTELHKVFSYFGDARDHSDEIKQHAEIIHGVVEKLSGAQSLKAEDIIAFSLLNRTAAILKLSSEYQKERADILEPIRTYIDIVSQYLKDKVLEFDAITGELTPMLKYGNNNLRDLSVYALSSGEKQILILLSETLLQQKRPFVFIADEPELSLHIEWQRNLINSIRTINPSAQILIATHAPEIASNHAKKVINMITVTNYVGE